jgi:hypothetical protein
MKCEHLELQGGVYHCRELGEDIPDAYSAPLRPENCPIQDSTNEACEVVEVQIPFSKNGTSI